MHLLIVSGGSELPVRARAVHPGLRTSVICQQQVVPYLQEMEKIERLIVFPPAAPVAEWVAAAEFIHRVDPVQRVTNYTEYDTDKTAAIAEALKLPAPSADTYRFIADKCAMRQRLTEAGVDDTPATVVRSPDDVHRFVERVGFPLICKPLSGVGSRGVSVIHGPDDVPAALRTAGTAAEKLDVSELMVEKFHRGREYSVEGFSDDGRHIMACVTEKHIESRHFVELGHVLPAPLAPELRSRIETTVTAALTALGVTDGVTHTEVIVTGEPGQVRIVETHLRPAGDEIPYLLAQVSAVDLIDAQVRQSVGLPVYDQVLAASRQFAEDPRYAAIWYANPQTSGEILDIEGIEAARAVPGVRDVSVTVRVGDRIAPVIMSWDRPAYAWAVGHSADEALSRARAAVARLQFHVVPVEDAEGSTGREPSGRSR